jgi:hypothetical protein
VKRAFLFVAVLVPTLALAHDDGTEFIWQNPQTAWCCNERDCRRAHPDEAVENAPDVWTVTVSGQSRVFRRGDRGFYDSYDGDVWVCATKGVAPRCFFAPPKGA